MVMFWRGAIVAIIRWWLIRPEGLVRVVGKSPLTDCGGVEEAAKSWWSVVCMIIRR